MGKDQISPYFHNIQQFPILNKIPARKHRVLNKNLVFYLVYFV